MSITPGQSAVTAIGSRLNGRIIKGAVFENDNLWAIDSENNELLRIDQYTGSILESKQLILNGSPYNISAFIDIAVAPDNSFWLADSCSGIRQFNINTAEVSSSQILPCSTVGTNNAFDGIAFSDNASTNLY